LQLPNNDSKPARRSAAAAKARATPENFFLGKKTRGQVQNSLRKMWRGIFETNPSPNEQKNMKFV
jgi:hypothetical protein